MSMDPKDLLLLVATCDEPRTLCAAAGLKEHPLAPRDMWLACASSGATDDGYWMWVVHTLKQAMGAHTPKVQPKKVAGLQAAIHARSRAATAPIRLEEFQRQLESGDF